jgi:hypothetical protein
MTKWPAASILALALVAILAAAPARADVQLTMSAGRVTLKATNATVREILAEWAKVGQARIVNGERLTGSPVTLELTNVTEQQALDVLLRTVAGYMAASRPTTVPNASQFDRILILPTSVAPRVVATPPPPPTFAQQPQFVPPPQFDDDQDEPRSPPGPNANPRGPVFNTFPQPGQPGQPGGPPVTMPARGNVPAGNGPPPGSQQAPVGVSVPGMVVQPPPPPPGQIQPPQ